MCLSTELPVYPTWMKLVAVINGTRIPLEGPFVIEAIEAIGAEDALVVARYSVEINANRGGGVYSQASGPGHASVATQYKGVSLKVDVKPG